MGQAAHRELTVTPAMVASYAEITGDFNPLHFDEDFSRSTRFGRLIAQGGIATGLLHALVAMNMPGPGSVFTTQSWTFPKPVYIGEIRKNGQFKIVHQSEGLVSPDSYSKYLHPDGKFPAPTGGPKK